MRYTLERCGIPMTSALDEHGCAIVREFFSWLLQQPNKPINRLFAEYTIIKHGRGRQGKKYGKEMPERWRKRNERV